MSNDDKVKHNRRTFLVSAIGLAGGAVGLRQTYAAVPCPTPQLQVSGGTSASTACGNATTGQITTLTLTSLAATGDYPWSFGQTFKKGDVPSGINIISNATVFQSDIRNRWSDGSAKFAVLSGLATFSQGSPKIITISRTNAAVSSGTNVAEPSALDVTVTLSGDVSGTYTLQSCLGIDRSAWSKANPGRVRQIPGQVMSEFHYYRPTSDAHIAIWFFVRRYFNGVTEIETVIENGWLSVASPGARNYSVSVTVSGNTKYSGSLTHYHHTRWSRVDWIGNDPQITPRHDVAYLRKSSLVPNYLQASPSSSAFTGFANSINPAPFALGNWTTNMGDTGAQDAIGLLPKWESMYCATGDARAYVATISNNRGSGRWPIHYRDETTGRIPLHSSYQNLTLTSGWGVATPAATGGGPAWDIPHHPSNGYLAYLLEGRWTALESLQFAGAVNILESNPDTRQSGGVLACINAPLTTRGAAWSWRSVGQAAAASPTMVGGSAVASADAAVRTSFVQSVGNSATWMKRRYVDGSIDGGAHKNSIGWLGQYDGGDDGPATEWWGRSWMVQFQSLALGHISSLEIENLAAADLSIVRDHSYDHCLRLIGDDSSWNYRRAALYNGPYLKNSSSPAAPVFMTTAEAFASHKTFFNLSSLTANSGDTLKAHSSNTDMVGDGSSSDGTGYWAMIISTLAMCVDHGKTGAANKYALVASASNFNPAAHGANDNPTWAIVPSQ